jgi:hypothetical protein
MNRGLLPGLIITLVGVVLTLHNFGYFHIGELRRFWPLLLVILGLSQVLHAKRRSPVFGSLLIAAGSALLLSNFGLLHLSLRGLLRFWPLILVAFGVRLLLDRKASSPAAGSLLVVLGLGFQARTLEWITFDLWRLWPVGLIILGIVMILDTRRGAPRLH